jgi:uncharacterized protein (TIGR03084 family)
MTALLDDLAAEHAAVDDVTADAELGQDTPAAGWTIGDTIAHLWFFDREATTALVDPEEFGRILEEAINEPDAYMARTLSDGKQLGADLPTVWRRTRSDLLAALRATPASTKVPWFGPPMSPASFATARLMEYWAHGQDIADALGVARQSTDRIRHICHLGVRTRAFSYVVRGLTPPDTDVYVELTGPSGDTWTWGEPESADRISGSALDFCLVVTQRRLVADTDLAVSGPVATEWMSIAQAFAGGATLTDKTREGLPPV